jgi:tetratricopeptide (TPR) repeat protein
MALRWAMIMAARKQPATVDAIAGSLRTTTLASVLIELLDALKTGTLRIADQHGRVQEQILFDAGVPVAARVPLAESNLIQALVPLCARAAGEYTFLEGRDEVGRGTGIVFGRVDPRAVITAAMRGPGREDAVHEVLSSLGPQRLELSPGTDLERYAFTPQEQRVAELLLQRPLAMQQLQAEAGVPERVTRGLVYVLAISHAIKQSPAARWNVSGTIALTAPLPAGVANEPSWEDEPTAPFAPLDPPFVRSSGMPPPSVRERTNSGVVSRIPGSHRTGGGEPAPDPAGRYHFSSADFELTDATELPLALAIWRKEILERAPRKETQSYFEVLGLERTSTQEEVEKAFATLSNRFGPEHLPDELAALGQHAQAACDHLSEAYETLHDPQRRAAYQRELDVGAPRSGKRAWRKADAEEHRRRAEILLQRRDYISALQEAETALSLDGCARHEALYAWSLYLRTGTTRVHPRALEHLERALKHDPRCERAYHYKAVLLKQTGQLDEAVWHFKRALKLDPKNLEAAREIRLHELRSSQREQSGFMKRLFGRRPPSKPHAD